MSKIMIICAHIDDETFAMGGTIHKLSKDNEILILSVCEGSKRLMSIDDFFERKKIIKKYENNKIRNIILSYSDTSLDSFSLSKIIDSIQYIYNQFKPDIVFTHSEDIHPDHNIVSRAVQVITRPREGNSVKKLYYFSIPGNNEWSDYSFKPNTYVEISLEDIVFKNKMIIDYNNILLYKDTDPLSKNKLEARASYVGSLIGVVYAEAFELKFDRSL